MHAAFSGRRWIRSLGVTGLGLLAAGRVLARRGTNLLQAPLDARPLGLDHRLEALLEIIHERVQPIAAELALLAFANLLQEILEAAESLAVLVLGSPAEQAVERALQITIGDEVLGERVENVICRKGRDVLSPVPPRVGVPHESPSITRFAGGALLVQLAVQVEPFEDELDRRGDRGRAGLGPELAHRSPEFRQLTEQADVALGRHAISDLDREAALETVDQRFELGDAEVAIEDIENGALDQLLDDAILSRVADSLQLDLALRRGDERDQVSDARCDLLLAQPDCPTKGTAEEILVVADRDPRADAGALAHIGILAGEVGCLGNDLLHEAGHDRSESLIGEYRALLLHNIDLVLDRARVVGPDLGPKAVLEWGNNPTPVGVVLRVGAGDDVQIKREPDLVAADLDIPLFHNVQQSDLNPLAEIRELID